MAPGVRHARRRFRGALSGPVAVLLLAAVGLGALPPTPAQPLPVLCQAACRFELLDVCGAGDAAAGMLADTPVLLAEAVVVVAESTALPTPPGDRPRPLEGFAPGVYHPPRPSC